MPELTKERVDSLFYYEHQSGLLIWKMPTSNRVTRGQAVRRIHNQGYYMVSIDGRAYLVHRVVWLMNKGSFPKGVIDHINHDGFDNRLENLRDVTQQENCSNSRLSINNTSGASGVHPMRDKWQVKLTVNREIIYGGTYGTIEEAAIVANDMQASLGFHANHGVIR